MLPGVYGPFMLPGVYGPFMLPGVTFLLSGVTFLLSGDIPDQVFNGFNADLMGFLVLILLARVSDILTPFGQELTTFEQKCEV